MCHNQIVLFESSDGLVSLPIAIDMHREEVWVTQAQMAELFDTDAETVGRHVADALREELAQDASSVVATFATAAPDGKTCQAEHFSLDVVLLVGYRVKSSRVAEFRRWATGTLCQRLGDDRAENAQRPDRVEQAAQVMGAIPGDPNSRQVLDVVQRYAGAFSTLDAYDRGELPRPEGTPDICVLDAAECRDVVRRLAASQGVEGTLFGNERTEGGLEAAVAAVYQGFGGVDAYPSVEEKAANLLYLVVKDHPFSDGNKRIGSCLFLHFLARNGLLGTDGRPPITNGMLVALTLMVAESRPDEKDSMVSLLMGFLTEKQM